MGYQHRAAFSYGIALSQKQYRRLAAAASNEEADEEVDMEDVDNEDSGDDDDDDDQGFANIIHSFLNSDAFVPFLFETELKCEAGGLQGEKPELLITFTGSDEKEFEQHSVEFWGYENYATKFKKVKIDEEYMEMGREAFNKVQDSDAFKKAKIEVTEPSWFLIISGH
ncbi:hypothetical protein H0H93_000014 [Arthromyces matolae]|nr:hypothetical protein H0H93_000014 [Arthromyces matolae]